MTRYRPALLVVLPAVVTLVVLVPLGSVTGIGERVQRLVATSHTTADDSAVRIVVSSGDAVIQRGDPVTLTAYLEGARDGSPSTVYLVHRSPGATDESKLVLTPDGLGGYSVTRPSIASDFEYCVEVGSVSSVWHTITVADPVALTGGSTLSTVPPRYASDASPPTIRNGFGDVAVPQYSRVAFDLRFTRPAADAALEFRPLTPAPVERVAIPLRLQPDRTAATADYVVDLDGTLVLSLAGERGIRTELSAAVRVKIDTPPRFEKVIGLSNTPRELLPGGRIPIDLSASDDLRLTELVLEYCVNGNEAATQTFAVPLPGLGTRKVEGKFDVVTVGKVREGETLWVRLKARDNRAVPDLRVEPHVVRSPANGWSQFRITTSARPLDEQEILAQRDAIRGVLTEAAQLVTESQQQIATVRAEQDDGALRPELIVRISTAREKAADARKLLGDFAREIDLTPDLRGLAGIARRFADDLSGVEAELRKANADGLRSTRDPGLIRASEKLAATDAALTGLIASNEPLAQARLDRQGLQRLARDQAAFAELARKNAAPADELVRRQKAIADKMHALVASSGPLTKAVNSATEHELRDLANRVRQLTEDWAALIRAANATDELARQQHTAELSLQQNRLAAEAGQLAAKTDSAARVAGTAVLDSQPLVQAGARLQAGLPLDALTEQEKAARELDRLSEALARAAFARGDTKDAARQFARWQEDLRRRYTDAGKTAANPPLNAEQRARLAMEQRAIRESTAILSSTGVEPAALEALLADLTVAAAALESPADAGPKLSTAAERLSKFADKTPSNEQRVREAKARLEPIRKEQDALTQAAEEVVRGVDPRSQSDAAQKQMALKLLELAVKQDAIANRLRTLDVPGHEARQGTVISAARIASSDLRGALPLDVGVSQQDLRRLLDRFRQALEGLTPADAQAADAARFQRACAEAVAKLPAQPSADDLRPLLQLQREIQRLLTSLNAPDAAGPLADAREASQALELAFRLGSAPDLLKTKSVAAHHATDRLADRLAGGESDLARVQRIATERAEMAQQAAELAKQPVNLEVSTAAQRQVKKHLEELDTSRIGKAQAAKKRALEALERLKLPSPERQASLQKNAAAELSSLVQEMSRNGDRTAPPVRTGPPRPTTADALRTAAGEGRLPTEADAERARALARRQRALRDATSEAGVDLAKGAKPAATDELARPLAEQAALADAIRKLAATLPVTRRGRVDRAVQAAELAATSLRVGAVDTSIKAGVIAHEQLILIDVEPGSFSAELTALVSRQSKLNGVLQSLHGKPDLEAARQLQRHGELVAEAARLTSALREVPGQSEAEALNLSKAADGLRLAHEKMTVPRQDVSARFAANEQLETAAKVLGQLSPKPSDGVAAELVLGSAVVDADRQMRQAILALQKPGGATTAAGPVGDAGRSLERAAAAAGAPLQFGIDR